MQLPALPPWKPDALRRLPDSDRRRWFSHIYACGNTAEAYRRLHRPGRMLYHPEQAYVRNCLCPVCRMAHSFLRKLFSKATVRNHCTQLPLLKPSNPASRPMRHITEVTNEKQKSLQYPLPLLRRPCSLQACKRRLWHRHNRPQKLSLPMLQLAVLRCLCERPQEKPQTHGNPGKRQAPP